MTIVQEPRDALSGCVQCGALSHYYGVWDCGAMMIYGVFPGRGGMAHYERVCPKAAMPHIPEHPITKPGTEFIISGNKRTVVKPPRRPWPNERVDVSLDQVERLASWFDAISMRPKPPTNTGENP